MLVPHHMFYIYKVHVFIRYRSYCVIHTMSFNAFFKNFIKLLHIDFSPLLVNITLSSTLLCNGVHPHGVLMLFSLLFLQGCVRATVVTSLSVIPEKGT